MNHQIVWVLFAIGFSFKNFAAQRTSWSSSVATKVIARPFAKQQLTHQLPGLNKNDCNWILQEPDLGELVKSND